MAISLVQEEHDTFAATSTTQTLTFTSTPSEGSELFAFFASRTNPFSPNPASLAVETDGTPWTEVSSFPLQNNMTSSIFRRVAGASEDPNVDFTATADTDQRLTLAIAEFSGETLDSIDQLEEVNQQTNTFEEVVTVPALSSQPQLAVILAMQKRGDAHALTWSDSPDQPANDLMGGAISTDSSSMRVGWEELTATATFDWGVKTTGSNSAYLIAIATFPYLPSWDGSFVRNASGDKTRVRMPNGDAASVRLSSGLRL